MTRAPQNLKSCGPQLLEEITDAPSHDWPLDRLTEEARREHALIIAAEQALTTQYWRLGRLLHLARKQFAHGQWQHYLRELGIDKTRAVKAMRIFETFSTAAAVGRLSVAEAYEQRTKRQLAQNGKRRKKPGRRSKTKPHAADGRSAASDALSTAITVGIDRVPELSAAEAAAALATVDQLTALLERWRAELQRRLSDGDDRTRNA